MFIDPVYRNKYRFLVAYANKRILGVYKIIGIKRVLNLRNRQRVCFEVDSLNQAFEVDLINNLQSYINPHDRRIISNYHIRFLDNLDVSGIKEEYPEEFASLTFPIEENNDPVFEIDDQYFEETFTGLDMNYPPNMAYPTEPFWYKLTVDYHSFDSFRMPVAVQTKTTITLSPSGIIKIHKEVNSLKVNASLDKLSKNQVKQLIHLFNTDSNRLISQLNASDKLNHVAHVQPISIEIKAFSDAANHHLSPFYTLSRIVSNGLLLWFANF